MKNIVMLALVLASSTGLFAQAEQENSFFSVAAGVSFPLGDFASTNLERINAGMAKNGLMVDLKYAHQFGGFFGMAADLVYGRHAIKTPGEQQLSPGPWEYYAILFGPVMTGSIGQHAALDVNLYTGTAFIHGSKMNVDGQVLPAKYRTTAMPLKMAVDFRFRLYRKLYFFTGINYTYLHANFNVERASREISFKQRMNTIGMNAGAGINF